ncbi:ensconsin, partial [Oryzias melastigma]
MTDQQKSTKRIGSSVYMSVQTPSSAAARPTAGFGLKVDERLKAAKERREEQQRLLASREQSRMEREQRARRYYQQQLQERRKKLLEQRQKEERRRAAVEEKRRLRLQEEQERFESAVRKTLEKSRKGRKSKKDGSGRSVVPVVTPVHKYQELRPSIPLSSTHNQQRVTCAGQTKAAQRPDPQKKSSSMKAASNHHRTPISAPPERPPQVRSSRPHPLRVHLMSVPREEPPKPVVRPDRNQLLRLKTEMAPVSPSPDPPTQQRGVRAVRAETTETPPHAPHATPPQA